LQLAERRFDCCDDVSIFFDDFKRLVDNDVKWSTVGDVAQIGFQPPPYPPPDPQRGSGWWRLKAAASQSSIATQLPLAVVTSDPSLFIEAVVTFPSNMQPTGDAVFQFGVTDDSSSLPGTNYAYLETGGTAGNKYQLVTSSNGITETILIDGAFRSASCKNPNRLQLILDNGRVGRGIGAGVDTIIVPPSVARPGCNKNSDLFGSSLFIFVRVFVPGFEPPIAVDVDLVHKVNRRRCAVTGGSFKC